MPGSGYTLLPGLIDAHVHVYNELSALAEALHYGVTTVLDLHNEIDNANNIKKAAAQRNDISDVLSAYNSATIPGGWPEAIMRFLNGGEETERRLAAWPKITDVEAAKRFVADNIAKGAEFIKIMQEAGGNIASVITNKSIPTPELRVQRAIVEAADEYGVISVAHAMNHDDTAIVLEAGVDGVAHAIIDQSPTLALVKAFQRSGAFLVPTLVVHTSNTGEEPDSREYFARDLEKTEMEFVCSCARLVKKGSSVQYAYEQVRALKAAGVDVVCGTDSSPGFPGTKFGLSLHHELWLYVNRCGFSPIEALRSATSISARRWRLMDRGLIKPGMKADLVLVRGDPTCNIESIRGVVGVWRNGVFMDISKISSQ